MTAQEAQADRLQRQLETEAEQHAAEITNLHWQNSALRERIRKLTCEQKAANAAVVEANAALAREQIFRQIDLEQMMAQVEHLSDEVAASVTAEERTKSDAALKECFQKHSRDKALKNARIQELEKAVTVATGKLHVLEASVESMLLDQAEVLRAEQRESEEAMTARHAQAASDLSKRHKIEMQTLRSQKVAADAAKARAENAAAIAVRNALAEASKSAAEAQEVTEKLQSAEDELAKLMTELENLRLEACPEDRPLSHFCKAILTNEEFELVKKRIPSLDQLGLEAASVSEMGPRRTRDLATVSQLLLSKILMTAKAGTPDPPGILEAISKLRFASNSPIGAALQERPGVDPTEHPTTKALANSFIRCMRAGDKLTARSMLSVLVSSGELTDAQVMRLCTQRVPIVVGDVVVVSVLGSNQSKMKVASIDGDNASLLPFDAKEGTEVPLSQAPISDCQGRNDVDCTKYQISAAKVHALRKFPGAKVCPIISRPGGIDPVRAAFVAEFLRDPTVVEVVEASLANSKRGLKWRLKQRPWPLWKRLVNRMESAGHRPVSWGHFWGLITTGEYELQTADNCCCGTCRDFGYRNYDELRDIITTLKSSIEAASNDQVIVDIIDLLARVKKEEEFRRGSFINHLSDSSGVGAHCLTMLLSSSVDRRFRKPCTHGRSDGCPISQPKTMQEMLRRKTRASDWNDACEICADQKGVKEETGNVFKCTHCNVVAHKVCIERSHWDLPSTKTDEWTCAHCVREIDDCQHDSSCDACNEAEFILEDVHRLIEVLGFIEKKPSAPEAPTKKAKTASPPISSGGFVAPASQVLSSRLEIFAAKQQHYISHLVRDRNQSSFKDLAEEAMTLSTMFIMMDYWAKFNSRKADVACCEGNQIGISTHGMMFVNLNPSLAERTQIDLKHGPQPCPLGSFWSGQR